MWCNKQQTVSSSELGISYATLVIVLFQNFHPLDSTAPLHRQRASSLLTFFRFYFFHSLLFLFPLFYLFIYIYIYIFFSFSLPSIFSWSKARGKYVSKLLEPKHVRFLERILRMRKSIKLEENNISDARINRSFGNRVLVSRRAVS